MIRLTRVDDPEADVIRMKVEGRITRDTITELESSLEELKDDAAGMNLDLSGVKFVDDAGAYLLNALAADGVSLSGCSEFLSALLRDEGKKRNGARMESGIDPDERRLVDALRRNDGDAYEEMVRKFGGRMLATARRMMRSEEDAHDVVQDAFVSAFRSFAGFTAGSKLSTWLHRITVNAALMKLRSKRRRPEQSIDELLPQFDDRGHWPRGEKPEHLPGDEVLGQVETRAQVRRCIDELPEAYRTVLMLRDIEDLDNDEVAELLDITPNAVKVRLHRARQALRTLLVTALAAH